MLGRSSQNNDNLPIVKSVHEGRTRQREWVVSDWNLQAAQEGKLMAKLDMLRGAEVDRATRKCNLPANLLAGPGFKGEPFIYKLKVRGNVQLRPMVCLCSKEEQYLWTVVARATEVQGRLVPADAAREGESCRLRIAEGDDTQSVL